MSDFTYRENGHSWRIMFRPLVGDAIEQCDFCGTTRLVGEQLAACEVGPGARPVFGVTPPPKPRGKMSWKEKQYL